MRSESRSTSRPWLVVTAIVALFLVSTACGKSTPKARPSSSALNLSGKTIGVVNIFAAGFFTQSAEGIKSVAEPAGARVRVLNSNSAPATETSNIQNLITAQVDAIIISPLSPTASVAAIKRASDAGIPVVCFNTCINDTDARKYVKAYVTSDQSGSGESSGKAAAEYIKTKLNGEAKFAYITCDSYEVCQQRTAGFEKGLKDNGITPNVLGRVNGNAVVTHDLPLAQNLLTAHPDVNVILANSEQSMVASVTAVRNAHLEGKVGVFGVGMDSTTPPLLLADHGILIMTTGQAPFEMGVQAMRLAADALTGKTIAQFNQFSPAPVFSHDNPEPVQAYQARFGS